MSKQNEKIGPLLFDTASSLHEYGGLLASNDIETFNKWKHKILPKHPYKHAKHSALRFLEALRREYISKKPGL
jgi:hypothetical protein